MTTTTPQTGAADYFTRGVSTGASWNGRPDAEIGGLVERLDWCAANGYRTEGPLPIEPVRALLRTQAEDAKRIADLEEVLRMILPRLAHRAECARFLCAAHWGDHGSPVLEDCTCEVGAVQAALKGSGNHGQ